MIRRRSWYTAGHDQLIHPHRNVLVLPGSIPGSTVPEVPLVEETSHHHADGQYNFYKLRDKRLKIKGSHLVASQMLNHV